MQLTSPPFWILPLDITRPLTSRRVGVAIHDLRGLVVFDPRDQELGESDRFRLYVAQDNRVFSLTEDHAASWLMVPDAESDARLGLAAYAAFLDPSVPWPSEIAINRTPGLYGDYSRDYAGEFEDCERERNYQNAEIYQELLGDQDAWADSEATGWYYED